MGFSKETHISLYIYIATIFNWLSMEFHTRDSPLFSGCLVVANCN